MMIYVCGSIKQIGKILKAFRKFFLAFMQGVDNSMCPQYFPLQILRTCIFLFQVPDPICTQKGPEERAKFYLDNNKPNWLIVRTNNGYVGTLQCLTSTS